jgi:hypothetical protein
MKAALALVFFACIAGSMAAPNNLVAELLGQGQAIAQSLLGVAQQQILAAVQGALAHVVELLGNIGRLDLGNIVQQLLGQFAPLLQQAAQGALASVTQTITNIIGGISIGRGLNEILADFYNSIHHAVVGMSQHLMNTGISAVLGAVGSLGGRGLGDIFGQLHAQLAGIIGNTQTAITSIVSGLTQTAAGVLESAKPHWEQLQGQLVGHGLNVLGSLSETINNLHGEITG